MLIWKTKIKIHNLDPELYISKMPDQNHDSDVHLEEKKRFPKHISVLCRGDSTPPPSEPNCYKSFNAIKGSSSDTVYYFPYPLRPFFKYRWTGYQIGEVSCLSASLDTKYPTGYPVGKIRILNLTFGRIPGNQPLISDMVK